MVRIEVVRRLLWRAADFGIMRGRVEDLFKRHMVVRAPDTDGTETLKRVEEPTLEPHVMSDARSAAR